MKVVRSSSLRTGRFHPSGNASGTHWWKRLCRPQGHGANGKFLSTRNSNYIIQNRTRDLLACSAVPQPPPRAPKQLYQIKLSLSTDKGTLTCAVIHFRELTVNEGEKIHVYRKSYI